MIPSTADELDAAKLNRSAREKLLAEAWLDFRKFCGLLRIQPKKGGERIPFILSPLQRRYCRVRTPRDIILKPRQIWMTTLECARDLHQFLTMKGARVVIVCQSDTEMRMFVEIHDRIKLYLESLLAVGLSFEFGRDQTGNWSIPSRDATMRVIMAGASSAAAVKKGRGGHVTRLHSTECAFFEYADETFNAMLESVAGPEHGTEIVHESTPNGVGGWYYEQWQGAVKGATGYTPHFFKWWDHPEYQLALAPGEVIEAKDEVEAALLALGVRPDQLKWYRRQLAGKNGNRSLMNQEYPSDPETCFLISGRPFFDIEVVDAQARAAAILPPLKGVETMHGALRIWKHPARGHQYVIGADTAEGITEDGKADNTDYSAAPVLDRATGEHVATLYGRFQPHEFARMLAAVGRVYNEALIAVERNNHGHAVLLALTSIQGYRNTYRHDDQKLGWPTTPITRPVMLDELDESLRQKHFTTPDAILLGEMRTFVIGNDGRPRGARGAHDDLVMAAAIAWAVRRRPVVRRALPAGVVA